MENKLHTISRGDSTHQNFVQKSSLRHNLFVSKSCLRRMFFIKNLLSNHSRMHLIWAFIFCLPIHWWWEWFKRTFKRSASVDMIWINRRDCDNGEQTTWRKQSLPLRYVDDTVDNSEVNEFLCTKVPLLKEVQQPKKSPRKPENALSDALLM